MSKQQKNIYIKEAYEEVKQKYPNEAYKYMDEIFELAKQKHKEYFDERIRQAKKANKKVATDHEQSWKPIKGRGLEILVENLVGDRVEELGLKLVNGNSLELTKLSNLSKELGKVKSSMLIDYGKQGCHIPDADLIIYCPKTYKVKAIISVKTTLRERIAQTGYWKMKIQTQPTTKHIKCYFITADSDGNLRTSNIHNKSRSIAETDTDGSYVLGDIDSPSEKIKGFGDFFDDLEKLKD